MISCYLTPSPDVPGWTSVLFCSGRRPLGRPTIIPTTEAWRLSSSVYRLALAYNVGAVTEQRRRSTLTPTPSIPE